MDSIAAAASVSKQTVYHHFGDKHSLFEAVIRGLSADLGQPLMDGAARRRSPEDNLIAFGVNLMDLMLRPQSLAFMRLLIAEAPRFEGLADMLMRAGMETAVDSVAAYLRDETARGRLAVDEPRRAAMMLLGMMVGEFRFRGLLGVLPEPSATDIDAQVRAAVGAFLGAYAVPT